MNTVAAIDLTDDSVSQGQKDAGISELRAVEVELKQVESELHELLQRQQLLQSRKAELLQAAETNARAPLADWAGSFAWDQDASKLLRDVFKLSAFRPQQREVINATMQGRDVLCLMPSGGGKSLCYQLPALLSEGCTLVVSPLLSLIQDQVLSLVKLDIHATSLTSLTPKAEQADVYKIIESDKSLRLLYATPERVVSAKRFMAKLDKLHKAGQLKRIAIDEAHCCSQWGNDFRPDYKKLGILKQQFPDVPILALTATATQQVRSDLMKILRISDCEVFKSSINRPNLFYEVEWKATAADQVINDMVLWIAQHFPKGDEGGIVYCLTRKDAETISGQLNGCGMRSGFYHADMDPAARQRVHLQWSQRELRIIVATIAFGMGINKPDVRFVIHHSLSKSIENYYQESGRAGRDGLPARCLLMYRPADVLRQAGIVVAEPGWEKHLFDMMRYAETHQLCRRATIARHFAEAPADCNKMCSVCSQDTQASKNDVSREACAILNVLAATPGSEKRLTVIQLIDRWRSSKRLKSVTAMQSVEDQKLAKAGSKDENERIIGGLLSQGILQLDFGFTSYATNVYLKASPLGLQGRGQVIMWSLHKESQELQPAAKKLRQA